MSVPRLPLIAVTATSLLVMITALLALAQEQRPTTQPSLSRNMETMGRAWRIVKANARDKTKMDVTLSALAQLEVATVACKEQVPAAVGKMEGGENAKKLQAYRVGMVKLLRQELELEDQLLAGDLDKVAETIAAIDDAEKAGHKDFRVGQ